MRSDLAFCLLQIRNSTDPRRGHEVECFVRRLEVEPRQVTALDVLDVPLDERIFEKFDALLIGGAGEFSVLDEYPHIKRTLDFIAEAASREFPTFGSCFGFQALSLALGGEVVRDPNRAELGTFEVALHADAAGDPLFTGLPERFTVQQGHKDHVTRLPAGASHLAGSERSPFQAARFGEGLIWGTQFHPELTEDDNRLRVLTYRERYALQLDAVLATLRASQHTHGLLARFADALAGRAGS